MSIDTYKEATNYEMLIRNVFECPKGMKNGADLCFMQNAMFIEEGKTYPKHLGSFEKQFKVVKGYISKAMDKALKMKIYSDLHDFFTTQKDKLEFAANTSVLMEIVNDTLEQILKYRKK